MFLYVYENSDDFNLTFPSAIHCQRLIVSKFFNKKWEFFVEW